ncbi:Short C-terminal domain-containing protein [Streptomyces sp. BpilaLS-43]|uniref:SHOCT domain-containing protein n=1 Tax=Streptomyces sp. BpilaLS-43 TaxID=1839778 RepID=UPI00081B0C0E|nr:SHOCT domain-containing protein [Streptomyces sp. BpilaLS-43]SCD71820.1 Short C-terminal domain-containing protein [Streptomyces sp. BpilaLS-43]
MGPVEYLVVTFPGSRFADTVAPVLAEALSAQAVRILDLAFARTTQDGTTETVELSELDPRGLVAFEPPGESPRGPDLTRIRALEDLPAGSLAALIVWEDLWSVPLTGAVRTAGGQLVAHERVPVDGEDDVITLLERLAALREQGALTDEEFAAQKTRILAD